MSEEKFVAHTDQSPPKIRYLLTLIIVGIATFVAVKVVLVSYWFETTDAYAKSLLHDPEQLNQLREKERKDLSTSPVPIDTAMKTLAVSGRDNAPALITPQPSDDMDPLRGWVRTKKDIPDRPKPVPLIPIAMGDGGAPDGGPMDGGRKDDRKDGAAPAPHSSGGHH